MDQDTPWRDKELFSEYYYERNYTQEELADAFGCTPRTIGVWRKKHGLPEKEQSTYVSGAWTDPDLLEELYIDKRMSTIEIASELGCDPSTVRSHLLKNDIALRSRSEAFTKRHPSICMTTSGYEYAQDAGNGELAYMHRLLGVAKYGFDAVANKDIHHRNGVPWDNRPENIEIIDHAEHGEIHSHEYWRDD